jgi:collagenase-like PrtC family protease
MGNLEFSVPYNENTNCLEEIFKFKNFNNNKITEIYLSGPQEYSASGRVMDKLNIDNFLETVKKIHGEGLKVNLVMNPTCEGDAWYSPLTFKKTIGYLNIVHREYGVESVTIANPIYISAVRKHFPEIEICASVLGDIDCVQRAVIYADLGADIITPAVSINRNLEALLEIKKVTKKKLRIMVNEGCLHKCPFRKFHFNYVSHLSKKSSMEFVFVPYCQKIIKQDPAQILKSDWVRPEDLRKYEDITNTFKIVGRDLPNSKILRSVKAYMEESWSGDLTDIVASSLGAFALKHGIYLDNKKLGETDFFNKVSTCKQHCYECRYCEKLAKELIKVNRFTEEKMVDKKLIDNIEYLKEAGLIT